MIFDENYKGWNILSDLILHADDNQFSYICSKFVNLHPWWQIQTKIIIVKQFICKYRLESSFSKSTVIIMTPSSYMAAL